jgi:hypothetical protein
MKYPYDSKCNAMRVKVVSKDMGAGENGAKAKVV